MPKIHGLTLAILICLQGSFLNSPSATVTSIPDNNYSVAAADKKFTPDAMIHPAQATAMPTSLIHAGDSASHQNTPSQSGTTDANNHIWLPLIEKPPPGITYYVDGVLGSDTNPGTWTQPFRTIQKGVNKLAAGDILYIRGGTYFENIDIRVSGLPSLPITISSYPGETAVINGKNILPGGPSPYSSLVSISGSNIILDNFEVKNSTGRGIKTNGSFNIIKNNNVHHIWEIGIYSAGSYNTIENNKVWRTSESNYTHGSNWSGAIAFGTAKSSNTSPYVVVRNNEVYQNSGEGILCMYTDNGLIDDNIVWDNYAEDIYLDQCSFTTVRNNLAYYTTDQQFWRANDSPATGIALSNEGIQTYPIGHDRMIYNNIIVNAGRGISFWAAGGIPNSALINDIISFNTIISNYAYGDGIEIGKPNGTHINTVIENNLVQVLGTPLSISAIAGLTYSHNLWSKTPSIIGPGDIIGNPLLRDPDHNIDISIDTSWYKLTQFSPGIGMALIFPDIQTDYFGTIRDTLPDIGAHEFVP